MHKCFEELIDFHCLNVCRLATSESQSQAHTFIYLQNQNFPVMSKSIHLTFQRDPMWNEIHLKYSFLNAFYPLSKSMFIGLLLKIHAFIVFASIFLLFLAIVLFFKCLNICPFFFSLLSIFQVCFSYSIVTFLLLNYAL